MSASQPPASSMEEDLANLGQFVPEAIEAFGVIAETVGDRAGPGLPPRYRELAILAFEIGAHKTNPPPIHHARKALELGATPQELAEVAAIGLWLGGAVAFRESGRYALHVAHEAATAAGAAD